MAQAGRGRKARKVKRQPSEAMVLDRTRSQVEARVRRGVVPGAEPEVCPVCGLNSEGWHVPQAGGKREWYHFGRNFNCVERTGHVDSGKPRDA